MKKRILAGVQNNEGNPASSNLHSEEINNVAESGDEHQHYNFLVGEWGIIPKEWIWEVCSFLYPIDYLKLIWINHHWYQGVKEFANLEKEFRFTKFIFDRIMLTSCKYSHHEYVHSEYVDEDDDI